MAKMREIGILLAVAVAVAFFLLAVRPRGGTYIIEEKAKEWNTQIYAGRVSDCGKFSSVGEALEHFGLPGPLEKCREDERRLIRFYDDGNVHGFLTCYPLGDKYFCCAQLAEGFTKDYNTWKERCS